MALIPMQSNTKIQARIIEKVAHEKEVAEISKATGTFESDLASHIRAAWESAVWEKKKFHQQMVKNLNQIHGEYEPDKLSAVRELGSEIYPLITDVKCRTTIGIIRRVLKEKPWGISPTPIPTLTPELEKMSEVIFMSEAQNWMSQIGQTVEVGADPKQIQQQIVQMLPKFKEKFKGLQKKMAKEKAAMMEDKINDQLTEGGYYKALNDVIEDLVRLKAGILKGPVYRKKTVRTIKAGKDGKAIVGTKEEIIPEWDAPSPFDIYPLPGVTDINRGGLIEKLRYTRQDLQKMIGLEGFDEDAIRDILSNFYTKGLHQWDWSTEEIARAEAEGKEVSQFYDWDTIDCLEYHDAIPGRMLIQWAGLPLKEKTEKQTETILKHDIDRDFDYNIVAWLIDQWIIKVSINDNPLGLKPYYKSSYVGEKGAFWGRGQPETIKDSQQMCAQAARALQNNVGIACLTGDTIVLRHGQDRKLSSVTIQELFSKKNLHNSGLRRTKLRSLNEETGEFFGNRVVDIFDNGMAEIFEVETEKGYQIKATGNHRFLKDDGEWQTLDDFDIGDFIGVNGSISSLPKVCIDCGKPKSENGLRCKPCSAKHENHSWNQVQIERARANRNANPTTARARHECQSKKKDFCEICGIRIIDVPKLELQNHHKDRCPWNNEDGNIQTLCEPCHHALHAREDSFGDPYLHRYLSFDRIISVEFLGEEKVYDLQMTGPNHNFVANGFISHNSGPVVSYDFNSLPPGMNFPAQISPWMIIPMARKLFATTEQKLIEFFQAQMHAGELQAVYSQFVKEADSRSVPGYAHGDPNVGGGGNTLGGLSLLMGQQSVTIEDIMGELDDNIIQPSIEGLYWDNYELDDALEYIGDVKIVAKGSRIVLEKQQEVLRLTEWGRSTANPYDIQIMGEEGRRYYLKQTAKQMALDPDELVPDKEMITPIPIPQKGTAPIEGEQTLDQAGNPVQGQENLLPRQ